MIRRPGTLRRSGTTGAAYLLLAPFLTIFLVFAVVPSLATFWLAWWDWDPLGGREWVGGANFERLVGDPRFWTATTNTLAIALIATVAQVGLGLGLAHLIHRHTARASAALRLSLLVPYVTSGAAIALLVAQLVDRRYGLLAQALTALGLREADVLAHPAGAWIVVAATVAWRWFGFTTLLMLAVLGAAPRELYQAAELDGAGSWAQFRFLSLPQLGPAIAFSFITSVVGALQLFAEPLLMDPSGITCGPARQCQTLALLVYEIGFREFQFGYAAAVSTAVFLLAAVLVAGSLLVFRRWGWTT